jgi:hypothetical protein
VGTTTVIQRVAGSARRAASVGRRWPFRRGRPRLPAVQAPARNHRHRPTQTGGVGEQVQHGVAAIGDHHGRARGQPPPRLADQLARPIGQLLAPDAARLVMALRRGQHGQEGQRPAPVGPGDRRQQHQADPAPAAARDEALAAGADGVAGDALGGDLLAPATFEGLVEAQDDRAGRREGRHQQPQQDAADGQAGRHRPAAGRQDGADQQHLDVAPDLPGDQWRDGDEYRYHRRR